VLTGAATLNADAYLYDPTVTDAEASSAVAGTLGDAFPKLLTYDVPTGGGGHYHLAIDSAAGFGSYTVTWQILPIPSEADDDIPGIVPASNLVDRDLNVLNDVDDVYRITIGAGQRLVASLVGDAGTDFDIYLYDKDATGLGDDLPIGGSSNGGSSEYFVFEVPSGQAGAYYVDVHCVSGTGAYTLEWEVSGVPAGAIDTKANATTMSFGNGTKSDSLDRLTDGNDFDKWTLTAGLRFVATLTADAGTDFDMYLYGADGVTPLVWASDSAYPEHIMWDVTATGTYYVEVVSFSGDGAYELTYATTTTPTWSTTARRSGDDRFSTAVNLSQSAFAAGSVTTVVLATGENFPDALSAAGLAGCYGSPVLLTKTASLPASVLTEIQRLGAHNVVIVGGTPAVSARVATSLTTAGLSVSRISGKSRYATSAAVADRVAAHKGAAFAKAAFIARGDQFPDALALAPFAYSQGYPVLLTPTTALAAECSSASTRLAINEIYIAGGTPAVAANVETALNALPSVVMKVTRLSGKNRYETAAVIAGQGLDFWWGDAAFVGIATGSNFPDALGGGAVCGAHGGVLLLTDPASLSAPAAAFLSANGVDIVATEVFGSASAVSDRVKTQINALLAP
jgi:putative cell wall-binding protein